VPLVRPEDIELMAPLDANGARRVDACKTLLFDRDQLIRADRRFSIQFQRSLLRKPPASVRRSDNEIVDRENPSS